MIESSKISIWWHMIIRGYTDQVVRSINSLRGLYDGVVIAVDDRPDSDEIFEVLQHYPNTILYRQNYESIRHFGNMRQDALNHVPPCDYVGRSDGDEVLVNSPYEIRKWLADTTPDAVNCATYYPRSSGWCKAGETRRNENVRIWKHGTRKWVRPAHEYPLVIGDRVDDPVVADITFTHIREDDSNIDRSIELMQWEIDRGNIGYRWFQAKEYLAKGDVDKSISLCFEYLKEDPDDLHECFEMAIYGMSKMSQDRKEYDTLIQMLLELKEHPLAFEYLAFAYLWKGEKEKSIVYHKKAKSMDPGSKYPLIHSDYYNQLSANSQM